MPSSESEAEPVEEVGVAETSAFRMGWAGGTRPDRVVHFKVFAYSLHSSLNILYSALVL